MKNKILLIVVVLGLGYTVFAQTEVPIESFPYNVKLNDVYFKDINGHFNKFLGTWEYSNGSHYFKITFYKQEQTQHGKTSDGRVIVTKTQYSDRIYSYFLYQYNGSTVYDTYPAGTGGLTATSYFSYIWGERYVVVNPNELSLDYDEPSTTGCDRTKIGELNLEHQYQGQVPQLIWSRTDRNSGFPHWWCPEGTNPDTSEFQIPANMVLTRVND